MPACLLVCLLCCGRLLLFLLMEISSDQWARLPRVRGLQCQGRFVAPTGSQKALSLSVQGRSSTALTTAIIVSAFGEAELLCIGLILVTLDMCGIEAISTHRRQFEGARSKVAAASHSHPLALPLPGYPTHDQHVAPRVQRTDYENTHRSPSLLKYVL